MASGSTSTANRAETTTGITMQGGKSFHSQRVSLSSSPFLGLVIFISNEVPFFLAFQGCTQQ